MIVAAAGALGLLAARHRRRAAGSALCVVSAAGPGSSNQRALRLGGIVRPPGTVAGPFPAQSAPCMTAIELGPWARGLTTHATRDRRRRRSTREEPLPHGRHLHSGLGGRWPQACTRGKARCSPQRGIGGAGAVCGARRGGGPAQHHTSLPGHTHARAMCVPPSRTGRNAPSLAPPGCPRRASARQSTAGTAIPRWPAAPQRSPWWCACLLACCPRGWARQCIQSSLSAKLSPARAAAPRRRQPPATPQVLPWSRLPGPKGGEGGPRLAGRFRRVLPTLLRAIVSGDRA